MSSINELGSGCGISQEAAGRSASLGDELPFILGKINRIEEGSHLLELGAGLQANNSRWLNAYHEVALANHSTDVVAHDFILAEPRLRR